MTRKKQEDAKRWPADSVERWKVEKLTPYARNARRHSDEQVSQIAASIEQFGFTIPVLVDEDGVIIAGHGRVMAAKLLNLPEVPVMVARGWSEDQRRAYTLADNQLTLNGAWDEDLLRIELGDLSDLDFDVKVIGFNDAELARLLASEDELGDAQTEWKGMPEFAQEDKTAFRSIPVHFKDQAAVDKFAEVIGQKITDKTRFVWFPEIEIETYADKRYVTDET